MSYLTLIIREPCFVPGGGDGCLKGDHGPGDQLEDSAASPPAGFHDRTLRPSDVRDALDKVIDRESWLTADPLDVFIEELRR